MPPKKQASPKEQETQETIESIRELISKLEIDQVNDVKNWLNKYVESTPAEKITFNLEKEKKRKFLERGAGKLDRIATYLKDKEVELPSKKPNESLNWPTEGFDSECTQLNSCEIDAFLFDDDEVDALVENDVLSRYYCPSCKSRDTLPLNFISHSLSRLQIRFVFDQLMSPDCQHVLDIGSRLGAIVYGASIFSNGNVKSVGVEIDAHYVEMTKRTIKQFGLKNIEIIQDDIRHLPQVFKPNQLIVMNNVFSFFLSKPEQEECWEFLHTNMLPGTVLVHHPPVDKLTEHLDLSFDVEDWLKLVNTTPECKEFAVDDERVYEEIEGICKYIVRDPTEPRSPPGCDSDSD